MNRKNIQRIYRKELNPVINEEITLSIDVSGICNSRCKYCYYHNSNMSIFQQRKFIEKDFFFRIVKEAYDLGVRKIGLYIQGEPLLNKDLESYIEYLKRLGYTYIYISTNGILCDKKRVISLVKAGIDSIKFSLNAASRENYLFHQGVDAFDIVEKNIIDTYEYCKKNAQHVKIFIFFIETKYNINETEIAREKFKNFCDAFFVRDLVAGPVKDDRITDLMIGGKKVKSIGEECSDPFKRISVDVDGYLLFCCSPVYNISRICNLNLVSLKEAWTSKEFQEFRLKHIIQKFDGTICSQCKREIRKEIEEVN